MRFIPASQVTGLAEVSFDANGNPANVIVSAHGTAGGNSAASSYPFNPDKAFVSLWRGTLLKPAQPVTDLDGKWASAGYGVYQFSGGATLANQTAGVVSRVSVGGRRGRKGRKMGPVAQTTAVGGEVGGGAGAGNVVGDQYWVLMTMPPAQLSDFVYYVSGRLTNNS